MADYSGRNGAAAHMLATLAGILDDKYIATGNEPYKNMELSALKQACDYCLEFWNNLDPGHKNHPQLRVDAEKLCNIFADLVRRYEPEYKTKYSEVPSSTGGGCYVATAVYGSYDCPQVWTLRRYRDYTLAETWYGRAFIRTYYAISPTLVKRFGKTAWFKKLWQSRLDRLVAKLQSRGIASTPYKDRKW